MKVTSYTTDDVSAGFRVLLYTYPHSHVETGSEEIYLEDICKSVAKSVGISTVTFPLFGFVDSTHTTWLGLHEKIIPEEWTNGDVYFRMRFSPEQKVLQHLAKREPKFTEYFYNQCRHDFLTEKLYSIYEQQIDKEKSFGLGVLERLIYCRKNDLNVCKIQCFMDSIPPTRQSDVRSRLNPLRSLRFNRNCKRELKKLDEQVENGKVEDLWMRFIGGIFNYVDNYLIENYDVRVQYQEGHVEDKRIYVRPNEEIVSVGRLKDIQSMEIHENCEKSTEFGWLVLVCGERVPKILMFKEKTKAESFMSLLIGYYRLTVNYYFCPVERMEPPSLKQLDKLCHGPVRYTYCKNRLRLRGEGTYIVKQSSVLDQLELIYKQKEGEIITLTIDCLPNGYFRFTPVNGETSREERLYQLIKTDKRTEHLVDAIPRKHDDNSGLLLCWKGDTGDNVPTSGERLPQVVVPFLNENAVTITSTVLGISGYYTEVLDGNMAKGDTRITIAVKRLKNRNRHKCLEPFLAMVHRMREMHSSYIVQLLGVCLMPPVYIALEYSPHGDLATYLKHYHTIVSPSQLLQAMLYVISALQYLIPAAQESRFLAHGNIRCRNIIVFHHTSVMEVKLGDPGLVYLYNQLPLEHQCNQERLPWLAPELRSDLNAMTPESEIYAFGTTVWEMWAKGDQPPNTAGEEMPASLAPDEEDKPWLHDLKEKVVDIIKSCRHDDPSKRMQVKELVRAIFTLEYGSDMSGKYAYVDEEEDLPSVSALGSDPQQCSLEQQAAIAPALPHPRPARLVETKEHPRSNVQRPETPPLGEFVFCEGWHCKPDHHEQGTENSSESRTKERDVPPPLTRSLPPSMGASRSPQPLLEQAVNKGGIEQMIGRDRVKTSNVIGSGHFGVVYKGEFKKDNGEWIPCAVKTLKQCGDSAQNDKSLEEEMNIMCRLNHENIVALHGFCLNNAKDPYCLVMEYVKKGSLHRVLTEARRPTTQIHRELTPQVLFNICHDVALVSVIRLHFYSVLYFLLLCSVKKKVVLFLVRKLKVEKI
ncbi:tyrosine-protein kinase JAK2-like [Liolophura sinensis]|uniref:tyrosine-protein kinase JAK2-like n=1 Tax=Liolophura sinensis TaxID=3198878 RepID=UPI0031589F3B